MDTVIATLNTLIATKEIPALEGEKMAAIQKYLFDAADKPLRIQVAETVFRHARNHPRAFDLFLASTLPLADVMARRQAERLFIHPPDMTIELMYDGAVNAAIKMFQGGDGANTATFRQALYRVLHCGAVQAFFNREENTRVAAADCSEMRVRTRASRRNTIEDRIASRELLEKIANLRGVSSNVRRILQCIMELGPDAVKPRSRKDPEGDVRRPLIDIAAVGEAMGIARKTVDKYLWQARAVLRQSFDPEGTLFLRKR